MRFFDFKRKPLWQHSDPIKRADAIATERSPALAADLVELAYRDPAPAVRAAAIRRVETLASLVPLAASERDPIPRAALIARFVELAIRAPHAPVDAEIAVLAGLDNEQRMQLARNALAPGWRRAALATLSRESALIERCRNDPDASIRRELLGRIDSVAALDRLAEAARKTDKELARAAEARAHGLRIQSGDPKALEHAALTLAERMRAARTLAPDAAAAAREALASEWRALEARIEPTLARRVGGHLGALDDALARAGGGSIGPAPAPDITSTAADDAAAIPPPGEAGAHPAPAANATELAYERDALESMIERLEAAAAPFDHESLDGYEAGFRERALRIESGGIDVAPLRQRFSRFAAAARARIEQDAAAAREAIAAKRAALDRGLDALAAALEAQDPRAATAADAELTELAEADGRIIDTPRSARLRTLRGALVKLRSQQRWSLNRQRQALVDDLVTLVDAAPHPDAVIHRVRELKTAWERIDAIELAGSGATDAEHPLARRFRGLVGRALAPTKRYFAERARLGETRADELRALLARTDAAALAVPRANALARRELGRALRSLDSIDPRQRSALKRGLSERIAALDRAKSDAANAAKVGKRHLLANLARQIRHADADAALALLRDAERAMTLAPRGLAADERELAASFSAIAEPYRDKAAAAAEAKRVASSEAAAALHALLAEAEAIAASAAPSTARIDAVSAALAALEADANPSAAEERVAPRNARRDDRGARPRGDRSGEARRERTPRPRIDPRMSRIEQQLADARQRAEQLAHAAVDADHVAQSACCRALEGWLFETPADPMRLAAARATLAERWQRLIAARAPSAALAARYAFADAALDGTIDADVIAATRADAVGQAARLAVHAECLAGIESPTDARALRQSVQVERLNARLRERAALAPEREWREGLKALDAIGPLAPADLTELDARFAAAAAALGVARPQLSPAQQPVKAFHGPA